MAFFRKNFPHFSLDTNGILGYNIGMDEREHLVSRSIQFRMKGVERWALEQEAMRLGRPVARLIHDLLWPHVLRIIRRVDKTRNG